MVPTQISCFFFAHGVFCGRFFSGLRANRVFIVCGCSAPLVCLFQLICIYILYSGFCSRDVKVSVFLLVAQCITLYFSMNSVALSAVGKED